LVHALSMISCSVTFGRKRCRNRFVLLRMASPTGTWGLSCMA
jgi:hypothetical protein